MRIWEKTDQGVIRKENQDACAANTFGVYTVAVVCDGMGGAKAGAVASSEATGIFMDALRHTLEESMTEEQIEAYCARWQNLKNFKNSPGGYDTVKARELLRKLFLK